MVSNPHYLWPAEHQRNHEPVGHSYTPDRFRPILEVKIDFYAAGLFNSDKVAEEGPNSGYAVYVCAEQWSGLCGFGPPRWFRHRIFLGVDELGRASDAAEEAATNYAKALADACSAVYGVPVELKGRM